MEHYKLDFKIPFLILVIAFLFTSCNKITNILDILGVIPPEELQLELKLEQQITGKAFSFADYCKEEYDSIFLVYPYFNTEKVDFVNLRMSDRLRSVCNDNTDFDSFSTLLFINKGEVAAFSEIGCEKIRLTPPAIPEEIYKFSFKQKFILDKDRYAHICEE